VGVGAPEIFAKNSILSPALISVEFDFSRIFGIRCSPVICNCTSR